MFRVTVAPCSIVTVFLNSINPEILFIVVFVEYVPLGVVALTLLIKLPLSIVKEIESERSETFPALSVWRATMVYFPLLERVTFSFSE